MRNKVRDGIFRTFSFLKRLVYKLIITSGVILLVMLIIAFTRIPYDMHRWLGGEEAPAGFQPSAIVMLGGSGMPSESNLIRLYYTSMVAKKFPDADIFILHPNDSAVATTMADHLSLQGIYASRINLVLKGTNTREQALALANLYPELKNENLLLITSPENMYRTVKTFRRAGFSDVHGKPAFENAMFVDLTFNFRKAGGKAYVPDVSGNLDLRYNFWNYWKLEITCLREYVAILYYYFNGWI